MLEVVVCCGGIILLLPLLVGGHLALRGETPLRRMAGLLTLKPFVTSPLWFMILLIMTDRYNDPPTLVAAALAVLPGAMLSLLTYIVWHDLFKSTWEAWVLLALDCLRWLNSFVLISSQQTATSFFALVGLALPPVFAIIAALIVDEPAPRKPHDEFESKMKRKPKPPQLIELADGEVVEVVNDNDLD